MKGLSTTSLLSFLVYLLLMDTGFSAEACKAAARLIAAQGNVEFRHDSTQAWQKVSPEQTFCQGDQLQVNGIGRAALRMANETLLRLDQNTSIIFTRINPAKRSLLDIIKGAIHSISRTPKSLDVRTPFVNAAIEGTEFLVSTTDRSSRVMVIEGTVVTSNNHGSVTLTDNQVACIKAGDRPHRSFTVRTADTVSWMLHYPSVLDLGIVQPDSGEYSPILLEAQALQRSGDPVRAIALLENLDESQQGVICQLLTSDIYLSMGDTINALKHLQRAARFAPNNAGIPALKAMIALVNNHLREASRLITTALQTDSENPVVQLAASYLEQRKFNIDTALQHSQQAVELAPDSALTHSRLAEVLLMTGNTSLAQSHARQATSINPDSAHAFSQLGFAALGRLALDEARTAFDHARELEPNTPLPYLGIGLIEIRHNHLKRGREALETAALLDPGNALIRSYLGKAYYEEERFPLAIDQFALARNLDPNDPTPWFYQSILSQSTNQPAKALREQQKALALNDNRAVYRSRNLLDKDAAARTVSLGRIYTDLGFKQVAKTQATSALMLDPTSHAAHRLLSDSYQGFNRSDASRRSELLQAQLLQPLNLMPMQPALTSSNLGILDSSGPGSLSYNEYNPMFVREGLFAQIDGLVAGQGTLANDLVVAGLKERFAFSASQFHYETDGIEENSDFKRDRYSLFGQLAFTEDSSIQLGYSTEDEDKGNTTQRFFNDEYGDRRFTAENREARVGFKQRLSMHSRLLASASRYKSDATETRPRTPQPSNSLFTEGGLRVDQSELQLSNSFDSSNLITGIGYIDNQSNLKFTLDFTPQPCPAFYGTECKLDRNNTRYQAKAYSYLTHHVSDDLDLTYALGWVNEQPGYHYSDTHLLPKLGLRWRSTRSSHIRAAIYQTYAAGIPADVHQTLEPTHIAGFNQIFDEAPQTRSTNYGLGWDGQFGNNVNAGVNLIYRDTETAFFLNVQNNSSVQRIPSRYSMAQTYLHWMPNDHWSMSLEYFFDHTKQETDKAAIPQSFSPDGVLELETHSIPLTLSYNHPSGVTGQIRTTYYDQRGGFADSPTREGSDSFWLANLNITYRPPLHHFSFSAGVNNLFDQAFHFDDQNSYDTLAPDATGTPSQLSSERVIFGKFTLSFR